MLGTRDVNLSRWIGGPARDASGSPAIITARAIWLPALAIVLGVALLRVVFVSWLSPYHLTEDEAFYWEWSRHLDWSYNTKGPGIAWSIALATELLGTSAAAIRCVAVVSSLAMSLAILGLTRDVMRGAPPAATRRAATVAAALAQLAPGLQVTGLLSTIDGPYLACWAVAAWMGYRALARGSHIALVALGVAVGVGFLFKYTIVLLVPGLVAVAIVHRRRLVLGPQWRRWLGVGALAASLGLAPVLVWNANHDWATVRHLLGHLGVTAAATNAAAGGAASAVAPTWIPGRHLPEFVGAQLGIIGPGMAALMAMAAWACWRRRPSHPADGVPLADDDAPRLAAGYLLLCAAPVLGFYAIIALFSSVEGNWPIAGYVTLIPLAAAWVTARAVPAAAGQRPAPGVRVAFAAWHLAIIVGVVSGAALLRLDLVQQGLARISPALAKVVPMSRVVGAPELAQRIDAEARALSQRTGMRPFIVAQHYGRAAQLAFYLPGRPTVYAASSRVGGRVVQQDFWPSHSLDDPSLIGRPAVVLADFDVPGPWLPAFDQLDRLGDLRPAPAPGGIVPPLNPRWGFVGIGYRGLPRPANPSAY